MRVDDGFPVNVGDAVELVGIYKVPVRVSTGRETHVPCGEVGFVERLDEYDAHVLLTGPNGNLGVVVVSRDNVRSAIQIIAGIMRS